MKNVSNIKFISEENYNKLIKDKQLNYLDKYIKEGNSKDKFKLFTLEVGRCKSVLTSFSMVETDQATLSAMRSVT